MPDTKPIAVKDLNLDLNNFRTVPQTDEISAIQTMIAISPDYFWGLMDSLLADEGYLPTENILVLDMGTTPSKLIVKEGNRRVAALKLILGLLPDDSITIPLHLKQKIKNLPPEWITANQAVPCAIYQQNESAIVDRIVTLAHGKGDKASRDKWSAVARARHNRNALRKSEPGLDILEKYLQIGTNLSSDQAKRWAGTYPLTVLDEAIKKVYSHLGASSVIDLAQQYPTISYKAEFDEILFKIGIEKIKFSTIRTGDFAAQQGIPPSGTGTSGTGTSGTGTSGTGTSGTGTSGTGTKGVRAVSIDDPKAVMQALNKIKIVGDNREKVVALLNELKELNIEKNPIAFCFLLRSMFEISAKAYCLDHVTDPSGPKAVKSDGEDRKLADTLKDIYNYMIKLPSGKADPARQRQLHGALIDISTPERILSVTTMNQLVHHPRFSIRAGDISVMFGNILPLLEDMNK